MQSADLAALLTLKDHLVSEQEKIAEQLRLVNRLIQTESGAVETSAEDLSVSDTSTSESKVVQLTTVPEKKQTRVRGVLAAARSAIKDLPDPFDKNQLLAKLEEMDAAFAKKITSSNIRNTLRLLTQSGVIRVSSEATAVSCAKYSKAA